MPSLVLAVEFEGPDVSEERIHRAVSADGTEIVGRIHGQGPPLVLVSGTGDGENSPLLLPILSDHFTCYSMSLRSRGLSESNADHAPERLVEDVASFVDSVGEHVGLAGHSRGAALALQAAARATSISAVGVYEPHVVEFYTDDDVVRVNDALERMQRAVAGRELAEAAPIFFEDVTLASQDELRIFTESGAFDLMAPNMPVIVQDVSQWQLPRQSHNLLLEQVTMPVMLMYGTRSHPFYAEVVRDLAERLPSAQADAITDAGHFAPQLTPAAVAERFVRFFRAND